jgi:hypothetical protein
MGEKRKNLLRVRCVDMDTRGFSKFTGYSTYVICSRVVENVGRITIRLCARV